MPWDFRIRPFDQSSSGITLLLSRGGNRGSGRLSDSPKERPHNYSTPGLFYGANPCTSELVLKLTTSRKPSLSCLLESHQPQLPEKEDTTQLPGKQGEDGRGEGEHASVLIIESWCQETARRRAIELSGKCHFRIVRSLLGPRPDHLLRAPGGLVHLTPAPS